MIKLLSVLLLTNGFGVTPSYTLSNINTHQVQNKIKNNLKLVNLDVDLVNKNLGEITDLKPETILKVLETKNPALRMNNIEILYITETSAIIGVKPNSVIYNQGFVVVTYTVAQPVDQNMYIDGVNGELTLKTNSQPTILHLTDARHNPIVDANVTILNGSGNVSVSSKTDINGNFQISGLKPGNAEIVILKPNFKPYTLKVNVIEKVISVSYKWEGQWYTRASASWTSINNQVDKKQWYLGNINNDFGISFDDLNKKVHTIKVAW